MRHRAIILPGIILLAALVTGLAEESADESRDDSGYSMQKQGEGLGAKLGLSDEKRAELKEQIQQMRQQMIELKSERDATQKEIEQLLEADSIDESAVWKAVDKMTQVTGDILKARVKTRIEISKLLTPEQKARMKELRQQMKQRRGERLEKWREQQSKRGARRDDSDGATSSNQVQETGSAEEEPEESF